MMKNCRICRKSRTRICGLLRDQIKYSKHVCGHGSGFILVHAIVIRVDSIVVVFGFSRATVLNANKKVFMSRHLHNIDFCLS